jgi:serine protease
MLMAADLGARLAPQDMVVEATAFRPPTRVVAGGEDGFEQNDSINAAWSLGALTATKTVSNLAMADKEDWFSFSMAGAGAAANSVAIRFDQSKGDIDLKLFNAKGIEIGSSTGTAGTESISLQNMPAGTYFVKIFGKTLPKSTATAMNPNYELTIKPGVPPTPPVELFGWYNFATNASNWGGVVTMDSQVHNGGSAASGGFNVEWYLSKDAVGSSDDILLSRVGGGTSYAHSGIAAGVNGSRFNVDLQLPQALPAGFTGETFHIIMKTDSANQIAEANEANNFGQIGQNFDRDQINITKPGALFFSFDAWDASLDDTPNAAIRDGALRFNYNLVTYNAPLQTMTLEAIGFGSNVITLGTFNSVIGSQKLVNLASIPGLQAGDYFLRMKATTTNGATYYTSLDTITLYDTWSVNGTYAPENLSYNGWSNTTVVIRGGGGTDTLHLNVPRSEFVGINGYTDFFSTIADSQAIYKGSAYDFIRLTGNREIYFQGIERLEFSDGSIQDLSVKPNDEFYADQWNLHVTDVAGAWRFTQGSSGVLLVSLDSGVLPPAGSPNWLGVRDVAGRLITDPTDDDNGVLNIPQNYPFGIGHGHQAINIMAATSNNGTGIAGINQVSDVMVADVYEGVHLQQAISDAIAYARANGKKVVFQGGIQGESWLTDGGPSIALTQMINFNADIALFAIAAGNGGPDGNLTDPNWYQSVSGVAKLEEFTDNVISVGALVNRQGLLVDGLFNTNDVWMASYSNRGSNLTLVAPTDAPALDMRGQEHAFGGTSAANPNMAAIASLVWSANPGLMAGGIRQILIDTAEDLGPNGDDNIFGNGLVNAEAAVRRAVALARSVDLASLYWGAGLSNGQAAFVAPVGAANAPMAAAPSLGDGFASANLNDLVLAASTMHGDDLAKTPNFGSSASQSAPALELLDLVHARSNWTPGGSHESRREFRNVAVATHSDLDLVFSLFDAANLQDGVLAV